MKINSETFYTRADPMHSTGTRKFIKLSLQPNWMLPHCSGVHNGPVLVLPEWAPAYVALAQVLVAGGLLNEQLHLPINCDHLLMREIIACVWRNGGRGRGERKDEGKEVTFSELPHLSVSAWLCRWWLVPSCWAPQVGIAGTQVLQHQDGGRTLLLVGKERIQAHTLHYMYMYYLHVC